ncbi:GNAT family N-acetyltransferase [Sphingomonas sp. SUN039]|uniref:GNAT family N-acetyltransferase n=1 Tax=Sphingomonas sp. SUN039 TaxID=2937787 RepID=UPI002164B843|nr:GNAT family protein [Sphingomonas sp. SUN039]UVO55503.1 GNAT family N-acetyltransferase [Sphingomonas sp. SUN039]
MSAALHGTAERMISNRLSADNVVLEPFEDRHVEPLRRACAEDKLIWDIYPVSMLGEHFDPALALFRALPAWEMFAVLDGDTVVGMTSYIGIDEAASSLEIGATYIAPRCRGTGFNAQMKRLLIDHAIACGFKYIIFKVDTRNGRSMAAVVKLGAVHVETLVGERTTWTGYLRDTAVYRLDAANWISQLSTSSR